MGDVRACLFGRPPALAREVVRRAPLEEENHRLLMRLHEATGDRTAAVRAFHECATVLGREARHCARSLHAQAARRHCAGW